MKNVRYKLDKDLLLQLYQIIAPSQQEFAMQNFLLNHLMEMGTGIDFEMDDVGNILVTKGDSETYPCICAHMDEVHDELEVCGRQLVEEDGKISGISPLTGRECGIGADDKNGIYVALEALRILPAVKVLFTVNEECGATGSRNASLFFFDDCRFVLSADRRNSGDLINHASGVELCSRDFLRDLKKIRNKYGYKPAHGVLADVMVLKERGLEISCLNLSCGYYNAHTDSEYTVLSELENCLNFVMEICETVTDVYPHIWQEIDSDEEEKYYQQLSERGQDDFYYPAYQSNYLGSGFYEKERNNELAWPFER